MPVSSAVSARSDRTRSIAFCGLSVALLVVSAWITIPLGPVPFTLQTFVIVFILLALTPKEALASLGIYLVMGAVGLPVFSSMRGGIGVIAGPTGGFLWGFLLGALVALAVRRALAGVREHHGMVVDFVCAASFLAVCYLCGWLQLAAVAGMSLQAAFLAGVAPFIIIDAIKLTAAVFTARAVRNAMRR
jgi:biotin transport system substrate-specific component